MGADSRETVQQHAEHTSMMGSKRVKPMEMVLTDSEEEGLQEEATASDVVARDDTKARSHRFGIPVEAWASTDDDPEAGFPAVDLSKEIERKRNSPGGATSYDVQLRKLKMQVPKALDPERWTTPPKS